MTTTPTPAGEGELSDEQIAVAYERWQASGSIRSPFIAGAEFARAALQRQAAEPEGFDAWLRNPYTKVLQDSIRDDYVPRPPDARPASTAADAGQAGSEPKKECGTCQHKAEPLGYGPCSGCRYSGYPNWQKQTTPPIHAASEPASGAVMGGDEPLSSFEEGQWWTTELDSMVANGTAEQKRAVAVVHHMLRAARAALSSFAGATVMGAGSEGVIDHVASQWDGCFYENAIGGDIDIGAAIRESFDKYLALSLATPTPVPTAVMEDKKQ